MGILFGLAASLTYGAADFLGGILSRRTGEFAVVLVSQVAAAVLLVPAMMLVSGEASGAAMWAGLGAGVGGGLGVTLLYRGLARGRMSIVAPTTAVLAACLPVGAGLATGERPGPVSLAGVLVALVAVVLIASAPDERLEAPPRESRRLASGIPEAIGAGLVLGTYLVLIDRAPDDSGLLPVAWARLSSVLVIAATALALRRSVRPARGTTVPIVVTGVLDMGANLLVLLAIRSGLLSLVGVVVSLYPASTVLLARLVLKEHIARRQSLGLGLAVAGVTAIALG